MLGHLPCQAHSRLFKVTASVLFNSFTPKPDIKSRPLDLFLVACGSNLLILSFETFLIFSCWLPLERILLYAALTVAGEAPRTSRNVPECSYS